LQVAKHAVLEYWAAVDNLVARRRQLLELNAVSKSAKKKPPAKGGGFLAVTLFNSCA